MLPSDPPEQINCTEDCTEDFNCKFVTNLTKGHVAIFWVRVRPGQIVSFSWAALGNRPFTIRKKACGLTRQFAREVSSTGTVRPLSSMNMPIREGNF